MKLRRLVLLTSLLFVLTAVSPTVAAADRGGRVCSVPIRGRSSGTVVIDLATGTGTVDTTGQMSLLGNVAAHTVYTSFTVTGSSFTGNGTATFTAADGAELFTTVAITGTVTATGSESMTFNTVTGGTGRLADAQGSFTVTSAGGAVSQVGSVVTTTAATASASGFVTLPCPRRR